MYFHKKRMSELPTAQQIEMFRVSWRLFEEKKIISPYLRGNIVREKGIKCVFQTNKLDLLIIVCGKNWLCGFLRNLLILQVFSNL